MWTDKVYSAIIGGAAGGCVSYITGMFHQRKIERDGICDLSHDVYGDIAVYWSANASDASIEKSIIKSTRKISSKAKAYGTKYLGDDCRCRLNRCLLELQKKSTGGAFQVSIKQADSGVIEACELVLNELRELLDESWVIGTLQRFGRLGQ